jgi:hypothetical protein
LYRYAEEKALRTSIWRRQNTIFAEFRKEAREREDSNADAVRRAASGYPKREGAAALAVNGGPGAVADESLHLASARKNLEALCVAAEAASLANVAYYYSRGGIRGVAGAGDDPAACWRGFKARARACQDKPEVSALLLELEDAVYCLTRVEFLRVKVGLHTLNQIQLTHSSKAPGFNP